MAKRASSPATEPSDVPKKWRELLGLFPGYDPFAQADGCWFVPEVAQTAIDFFPECLRHIEGEKAGQPFVLERWQQSIVANLFGWKRKDDYGRTVRRYRQAFIEVPRKNGKTPLCAGIGLYVLFCDDEAGQQDYIAAGNREQAGFLFRQAKGMVDQEPELERRCRIYGGKAEAGQSRSIVREDVGSYLRVIAADASTKHGGNTHLFICDELHVQPNRELIDVMETSLASKNRKQPMEICITTAGHDRKSICWEKYQYACSVRDNGGDRAKPGYDPTLLPVIYETSPEEDWTSEAVWRKANPNLDVSVSIAYLRDECRKAQEIPAKENAFRQLHLDQWTEQAVRWLPIDRWDACAGEVDEAELVGRECYSGLDLSSKIDLTAHALVFPPIDRDPLWRVLVRFWMPKDTARRRSEQDRVPYVEWARAGVLTLTEGNVVDYDFVKASILEDARRFDLRQIGYDPWNATQIALQLQADGAPVMEFRQGFVSMSEPCKELERLLLAGKIAHGGHPVLRWNAANVAVRTDPAGNLKPDKGKSTERIDGVVAVLMGLGLAIAKEQDDGQWYTPGCVYDRPKGE